MTIHLEMKNNVNVASVHVHSSSVAGMLSAASLLISEV
jgi:hypothetical protein